jgi:general secretion pathway protein K
MMRERGIILIVVLWIVATLAVLVAVLNSTVNKSARLAQLEDRRLKTQAMLDAGLEIAAAHLQSKNAQGTTRWLADGRAYESPAPGGTVKIRISDVSGLIDINKADERLLAGLFAQFAPSLNDANALAEAIVDWRKPDAEGGSGGAGETAASEEESNNEDEDEAKEENEDQPATRRFMSLTQLYSFPGAERQLVSKVVPFLTIYSAYGVINPAAAPREVLASLPDISPQEIETLLQARIAGRLDSSDAQAILAKFEDFVLSEDDEITPMYIVTVEAHGPRVLSGSRAETTIIAGASQDQPYHVLAQTW